MGSPLHSLNWIAGWLLVLSSFATGAVLGLHFHRDDFLHGYSSFPRRMLRLGHVALAALGMLNVLFSLSPWPRPDAWTGSIASVCFLAGGLTMPALCFLTAWRPRFRHLFAIPVVALVAAVISTCIGGLS
jgi:hypothetical protein